MLPPYHVSHSHYLLSQPEFSLAIFKCKATMQANQSKIRRLHAILSVLQGVNVKDSEGGRRHTWRVRTFKSIRNFKKCFYCQKHLIGLSQQGQQCTTCKVVVHKR